MIKYMLIIFAIFCILSYEIGKARFVYADPPTSQHDQRSEITEIPTSEMNLDITKLPVRYGYSGESPATFSPGYFDAEHHRFYQWKGVKVGQGLLPPEGGPASRILERLNLATKGLIVDVCDPPVRFVRFQNGNISIGYYDWGRKYVFCWKGINIDSKTSSETIKNNCKLIDAAECTVFDLAIP